MEYVVEYVITARTIADAVRLHQSRLLVRYRLAMLALAGTGVAVAVLVDGRSAPPWCSSVSRCSR